MHAGFHNADVQGPELSVLELSGTKTADCSGRVLAIGGEFFFYPRSIFNPVIRGQTSNYLQNRQFFQLYVSIS